MPFWKGDARGAAARARARHRPADARAAAARRAPRRRRRLVREHDLDGRAAENLLQYLRDQHAATGAVPDDRTIVVERVRDELGDWRVCVLSPLRRPRPRAVGDGRCRTSPRGARARRRDAVERRRVRRPVSGRRHAARRGAVAPRSPDEVQALVVRQLGATALFAAKFRENAARALLLPRRRPVHGRRSGSSASAPPICSRWPRATARFPMLLETYRECLRDVFDMPALVATLRGGPRAGRSASSPSTRQTPSPFAASLLFSYVANFIYDGDAPLAERRAQALAVDQAQLRELLGDAELRELLDADAIDAVEASCSSSSRASARAAPTASTTCCSRSATCRREDASRPMHQRAGGVAASTTSSRRAGRCSLRVAGEPRFIAARTRRGTATRSASRSRPGFPRRCWSRCAIRSATWSRATRGRTRRSPRRTSRRGSGLPVARAEPLLEALAGAGGWSRASSAPAAPGASGATRTCLRMLRRRSLATRATRSSRSSRRCSVASWRTGTASPDVARGRRAARRDRAAAGVALPASILETEILPARVERYDPGDLDALVTAGRGRLGRRRAARRARRPHRAVPGGSPAAPAAPSRPRGSTWSRSASAPGPSSRCCGRRGRASSPRCTRRLAAALPGRRWRRSGTWSGRAW